MNTRAYGFGNSNACGLLTSLVKRRPAEISDFRVLDAKFCPANLSNAGLWIWRRVPNGFTASLLGKTLANGLNTAATSTKFAWNSASKIKEAVTFTNKLNSWP